MTRLRCLIGGMFLFAMIACGSSFTPTSSESVAGDAQVYAAALTGEPVGDRGLAPAEVQVYDLQGAALSVPGKSGKCGTRMSRLGKYLQSLESGNERLSSLKPEAGNCRKMKSKRFAL